MKEYKLLMKSDEWLGDLTLKRLGHFLQDVILFSNLVHQVQYFYIKLVQHNGCFISIVDADGLVLYLAPGHQ